MNQLHSLAGARPSLDVETRPGQDVMQVIVRGVADPTTHDDLRAGLSGVDLGTGRDIHLHLSELRFCDTSAGFLLVSFMEHARYHGREVAVVAANPGVRLLVTMLDAGTDLTAGH